jgi:hypothetical protein
MVQPDIPSTSSTAERVERASRVLAMLARWAAEDVREEPEWDVEEIERISFRRMQTDTSSDLSER